MRQEGRRQARGRKLCRPSQASLSNQQGGQPAARETPPLGSDSAHADVLKGRQNSCRLLLPRGLGGSRQDQPGVRRNPKIDRRARVYTARTVEIQRGRWRRSWRYASIASRVSCTTRRSSRSPRSASPANWAAGLRTVAARCHHFAPQMLQGGLASTCPPVST